MEQEQAYPPISSKTILAFFAMVVGMFMAILDIQIVASSLSVIAAGLSASTEELSWIQTSYLISEVIIIPVTGFAARLLSTRISYFIAATGFTIMSLMCAIAWNIESMIIFRALQGFFGGAMIPTVFGAIFILFPPSMRPKISVLIGLVVTVAPTIGPTLGGYITESLSWHFMFLLNIIPGIFVSYTVFKYVDFDKPNYNLLKNFDLLGVILMVICLGSMQYVLEEGNNKDWFDDIHILILTITVSVTFIWLIIREITFSNPIIDLSAFRNRNFSFGCIYSFILGVGMYGSVYLLPLFLARVAGFNTLQIGITINVTGAFQFVSAPIAGKVFGSGLDKRMMLGIGFILFGLSTYINSFLTADSQYWELFVPQMIRGFAMMFCFIPINDLALGTMKKEEVQNASGLYNLTRNLGGAIGLAAISNLLTTKAKVYEQSMKDNMSLTSINMQETLGYYTQFLEGKIDNPTEGAYILITNIIEREAFIMAINNVYIIMSLLFCVGMMLIPFCSPPKTGIEVNAH